MHLIIQQQQDHFYFMYTISIDCCLSFWFLFCFRLRIKNQLFAFARKWVNQKPFRLIKKRSCSSLNTRTAPNKSIRCIYSDNAASNEINELIIHKSKQLAHRTRSTTFRCKLQAKINRNIGCPVAGCRCRRWRVCADYTHRHLKISLFSFRNNHLIYGTKIRSFSFTLLLHLNLLCDCCLFI